MTSTEVQLLTASPRLHSASHTLRNQTESVYYLRCRWYLRCLHNKRKKKIEVQVYHSLARHICFSHAGSQHNCFPFAYVVVFFSPFNLFFSQAWKKRWFILRSGRMSGDPDVLEYYKNDHSKKPIRVIDLHCCEQVDAGLTFKRKEFQDSFVFDIKTSDRTFYLVAETEEEMNKWVRSICQLCGFNQSDDNHGRQTRPVQAALSLRHCFF